MLITILNLWEKWLLEPHLIWSVAHLQRERLSKVNPHASPSSRPNKSPQALKDGAESDLWGGIKHKGALMIHTVPRPSLRDCWKNKNKRKKKPQLTQTYYRGKNTNELNWWLNQRLKANLNVCVFAQKRKAKMRAQNCEVYHWQLKKGMKTIY